MDTPVFHINHSDCRIPSPDFVNVTISEMYFIFYQRRRCVRSVRRGRERRRRRGRRGPRTGRRRCSRGRLVGTAGLSEPYSYCEHLHQSANRLFTLEYLCTGLISYSDTLRTRGKPEKCHCKQTVSQTNGF